MTNEQTIRDAISRSIQHNEIVHVSVDGDADDIQELVESSTLSEWDYNEENKDDDGNIVLDVYSLDSNSWRIKVTFYTGEAK